MVQALCWLRRDLRLHDHRALSQALTAHKSVACVFVFDELILNKLPEHDRRLTFIIESLEEVESELQKWGSRLLVLHGDPTVEIPRLSQSLKVQAVYANRDYESYASKRDEAVKNSLSKAEIAFETFKDHVIFEASEVVNQSGALYKVFTPYKNQWLKRWQETKEDHRVLPSAQFKHLASAKTVPETLEHFSSKAWYQRLGFKPQTNVLVGGRSQALIRLEDFVASGRIKKYHDARNIPAIDGTSSLSPYIRHGCLSIREMAHASEQARAKSEGAQVWLSELIWRDFYQTLLSAFPHVEKKSFKPEYEAIKWQGSEKEWHAWCEGRTGYPLVDAAMRCLNATGLMHNRLRMVVASFLCKTLLIDWRKGEAYFALKLLDFDLAANNGGWQWSSSSGCDAQPYFRIFNPYNQSEKFDPQGLFIRQWCPELAPFSNRHIHAPHTSTELEQAMAKCRVGSDYPAPIVSYEKKRQACLNMYQVVKKLSPPSV